MTTLYQESVNCATCGEPSEQVIVGSTNAFGSPDLDLRPPEMHRSTIDFWLQFCPHCGACAPDLSEAACERVVLDSAGYQAILTDQRLPDVARRFLAYATLMDKSDIMAAAQARLRAAWVCDDARREELAVECRLAAARTFEGLKPFEDSEPGITLGLLSVDILRRAGRFGQAAAECDALLAFENAVGSLRQILNFQRRRIAAGDRGVHRIDECEE
jgi:hypothetical protein